MRQPSALCSRPRVLRAAAPAVYRSPEGFLGSIGWISAVSPQVLRPLQQDPPDGRRMAENLPPVRGRSGSGGDSQKGSFPGRAAAGGGGGDQDETGLSRLWRGTGRGRLGEASHVRYRRMSMTKSLFIAEKPSVAQEFAKALKLSPARAGRVSGRTEYHHHLVRGPSGYH